MPTSSLGTTRVNVGNSGSTEDIYYYDKTLTCCIQRFFYYKQKTKDITGIFGLKTIQRRASTLDVSLIHTLKASVWRRNDFFFPMTLMKRFAQLCQASMFGNKTKKELLIREKKWTGHSKIRGGREASKREAGVGLGWKEQWLKKKTTTTEL